MSSSKRWVMIFIWIIMHVDVHPRSYPLMIISLSELNHLKVASKGKNQLFQIWREHSMNSSHPSPGSQWVMLGCTSSVSMVCLVSRPVVRMISSTRSLWPVSGDILDYSTTDHHLHADLYADWQNKLQKSVTSYCCHRSNSIIATIFLAYILWIWKEMLASKIVTYKIIRHLQIIKRG